MTAPEPFNGLLRTSSLYISETYAYHPGSDATLLSSENRYIVLQDCSCSTYDFFRTQFPIVTVPQQTSLLANCETAENHQKTPQ